MKTRVKDAMHVGAECMEPTATLGAVADRMLQKDIGLVAIADKTGLLGVVTDRDIVVRGLANGRDLASLKAADVMSAKIVSCAPDDTVQQAAQRMAQSQVRRLPVIEQEKVVGILSLGDIAQADDVDDDDVFDLVKSVADHHV